MNSFFCRLTKAVLRNNIKGCKNASMTISKNIDGGELEVWINYKTNCETQEVVGYGYGIKYYKQLSPSTRLEQSMTTHEALAIQNISLVDIDLLEPKEKSKDYSMDLTLLFYVIAGKDYVNTLIQEKHKKEITF